MKSCKYKKLKQQQSLDGGNSWFDVYQLGVLVTKKGDLIASNSSDCGYMGEYIRWVETIGYICDNTTRKKYAKERKQTSTDGINWTDTTEFRQGRLLEEDSMDCGYVPPLTGNTGTTTGSTTGRCDTVVTYSDGSTKKFDIHGKLSRGSIDNISAATKVDIGTCVTSIGDRTFWTCKSLTSINFNGTTSQWNSITKGSGWNNLVPATVVHCTDGDINL